ncbi:MAG: CapA family protein [Micromonosporaceae bacterium]|nr:CapA family protein [Micromonosporaceae bacterium]
MAAAAALLLLPPLALVGCGSGGGGGGSEHGRWRTGPGSGPASGSPSPAGPPEMPPEITLAFAGDVHFPESDGGVPNRTGALLADPQTAFGPVAEVLAAADLAMLNLETAVTTGGTPEPKAFHFRAPPAAYQAVRAAGVDVVSLANNHALDYGRDGLADTLAHARDADVPVVGAGVAAAAAYAPWVAEVSGVRIAYLALSQVSELWESWRAGEGRSGIAYAMDAERALAAVAAARSVADLVVVFMHWGVEGSDCPDGRMTDFAAELSAAGADLVVGSHAHLMLGDGWLGRTFVQYGLGNFLWWRDDRFSNDTGVLWVTLRGPEIESVELRPAVISRETGQPIPATGEERDRIAGEYATLRACTGLADAPEPAP